MAPGGGFGARLTRRSGWNAAERELSAAMTRGKGRGRARSTGTAQGTDPTLSTPLRTSPDARRASDTYDGVMHQEEPGRDLSATVDTSTEEGPALRDAAAAAARAEADEAAAQEARERFRETPIEAIAADDQIGPHLQPGERVHSSRSSAILRAPGDDRALGYGGTLYLTSHRLVHLGQVTVNVQLTDIVETALAGERLLVTLENGEGFSLDLDRPRLFRAEIAAVARGLRA
jgi:hypothetical protein